MGIHHKHLKQACPLTRRRRPPPGMKRQRRRDSRDPHRLRDARSSQGCRHSLSLRHMAVIPPHNRRHLLCRISPRPLLMPVSSRISRSHLPAGGTPAGSLGEPCTPVNVSAHPIHHLGIDHSIGSRHPSGVLYITHHPEHHIPELSLAHHRGAGIAYHPHIHPPYSGKTYAVRVLLSLLHAHIYTFFAKLTHPGPMQVR